MSRCQLADTLLQQRFAGSGLTASEEAHVGRCPECARVLAHARRFDSELRATAEELVSEPIRASVLTAPIEMRGRRMGSTGRNLLYAVASFALVAMILGGGWWLGQTSEGRFDIGGWASGLFGDDDGERRERAEQEAQAAAAEAARRQADDAARREAAHRAAQEEARRLAAELQRNVEIMEAVVRDAGVPRDVSALGVADLAPDLAVSVVKRDGLFDEPQRWFGLVRRDGERWAADPSDWLGVNIPVNDGLTAYELDILAAELDGWIVVGEAPASATSVELVVGGRAHAYPLHDGGGIVLVAPDEFDGTAEFRVRGLRGEVVLEGSIR